MPYSGPRNPDPGPGESFITIYGYVPSLAFGIIAMICFLTVLAVHTFWLVRSKRTRWFQGLMIVGCTMESVGYIFRILSHYHPFKVVYFVIQYFMIVCAPIAFSAAFYLAVQYGLAARTRESQVLPFRPRVLVITFITIDVITTIIQVAGAALIGVSESAQGRGESSTVTPAQANDILLAGLAFQCASFLVYLGILTFIIIRSNTLRKSGTKVTSSPSQSSNRSFWILLYISSALVFTRTLFRLAETAEGLFSFASTNESLFGVFEFAPVIIAVGLWAVWPIELEMKRMNEMGEEEKV